MIFMANVYNATQLIQPCPSKSYKNLIYDWWAATKPFAMALCDVCQCWTVIKIIETQVKLSRNKYLSSKSLLSIIIFDFYYMKRQKKKNTIFINDTPPHPNTPKERERERAGY